MRKPKQKRHEKNKQKDYEKNLKEAEKNPKTKSLIEFNTSLACSIKALAVKQGDAVKPTGSFFSGKMLMFAKIALISFKNDLVEILFFFQTKKQKKFTKSIKSTTSIPFTIRRTQAAPQSSVSLFALPKVTFQMKNIEIVFLKSL